MNLERSEGQIRDFVTSNLTSVTERLESQENLHNSTFLELYRNLYEYQESIRLQIDRLVGNQTENKNNMTQFDMLVQNVQKTINT